VQSVCVAFKNILNNFSYFFKNKKQYCLAFYDHEIQYIKTAQDTVDQLLVNFLKTNLKVGISEQVLNFKLQQVLQNVITALT